MEQGNTGRGSPVSAPLRAGCIPTAGTLRITAHGMRSSPETTVPLEAQTSGAGSRLVLKAFGPVQQHDSNSSGAACRFASGLPARRRLLGRRQQQQQEQGQTQSGMAGNTAHGSVAGSRSCDSSAAGSNSRRKRPTIKEFLGVNPADILMPRLSPPKMTADEQMTQHATRGASTSEGVSPLAFFPVQDQPQKQFQKQKHSMRQKPSVLSSFFARLLPLGGTEAPGAAGTAEDTKQDANERVKQQPENTGAHRTAAAAAAQSPGSLTEAPRPPPGIVFRPNAPVVPAFNASEGDRPVWKPIVYESKPIYLLPDGNVSNMTNDTQTTVNSDPLRNSTHTGGTLPGCTVTTAASCFLPAAKVSAAGSMPPTAARGHGAKHVSPGLHEAGDGLLQPQTPLTASSLPGEDDSSDQNEGSLTNYQKYLKWKEQQCKQQLLYQQQCLQQQQQLTAQWMKTIDNLIPPVQPWNDYGASTYNAAQKPVPPATPWGQQHQEQPLYLQQQQPQPFSSQPQPFVPQQQPFNLLQGHQKQPFDPQQPCRDSQPQPFDTHEHQQHLPFDPQHQLQALNAQQQLQQQHGEQQQFQTSPLQNVSNATEEQEMAASDWVSQPQQHASHQQGFLHEDPPSRDSWQALQQWEGNQNDMQQGLHDEGCYGTRPSLQQLYLTNQTTENGYVPQMTSPQYPIETGSGSPVQKQHVSPELWMAPHSDVWDSTAPTYVGEEGAGPIAVDAATAAGQQVPQAQGVNHMPNFFPQPAYSPQLPSFSHAMRPVPGAPFHPGFNYAEGISVHYNYYDAEEWSAKLQAAAATQRESSGSTQAGAEQEAARDASGASLSLNSEAVEDNAADLGLKPLITSKQRLSSGQVFAYPKRAEE